MIRKTLHLFTVLMAGLTDKAVQTTEGKTYQIHFDSLDELESMIA